MKLLSSFFIIILLSIFLEASDLIDKKHNITKKVIYLVPEIKTPFWQIMANGMKDFLSNEGYEFDIYSAQNNAKNELQLTIKAIKENATGIIVSPTNSSACVTILKLAKKANIPVVISDIGTDSGDYVSFISSNNKDGAYKIGKILTDKMKEKNVENGKVGIIAIPQKRLNGQERTAGFIKALNESNIKGADIKQMIEWTDEETYNHVIELINKHDDLKAIWLQTSNLYASALRALKDANKQNEIILIAFDAEPEFLDLIPNGIIIASGMQQPYLMGKEAAIALHKHLNNKKVDKNIQIPILDVSTKNIEEKLPIIKQNVLGL